MGFPPQSLEALKQPEKVSVLVNAKVAWCSVRVNRDVLLRLLNQTHDVEQEIEAIDRMLRLGASTEMVNEFHGLTHQEVALRRQVLGLRQRKGRWPVLTEEQETALWKCWHENRTAQNIDLKDDAGMLALAMDLAEQQTVPLSVVWGAIRHWIEQGLT
jgi:hypothetical protein